MTRSLRFLSLLALAVFLAEPARAGVIVPDDSIKLQDVQLDIPNGWRLTQEAASGDSIFAAFAGEHAYVTIFVSGVQSVDMRKIFVNGSRVTESERQRRVGEFDWTRLDTVKSERSNGETFVAAFAMSFRGHAYYGYASAGDAETAKTSAERFLAAMN